MYLQGLVINWWVRKVGIDLGALERTMNIMKIQCMKCSKIETNNEKNYKLPSIIPSQRMTSDFHCGHHNMVT